MKYLLPCSCGKTVAVEVSQAGSRVQCVCGNALDIPTMRLIRQLPEASTTTPPKSARSPKWSLTRRLLFATGLTVAVGGFATSAFFQFVRFGLDTEERPWDNIEMAHRDIDQMDLDKTWELWKIVRTESIGAYQPPPFIQLQFFSAAWLKTVIGGVVAVAVGLVLVVSAFLSGPRARPSVRKQRSTKDPSTKE